MFDLFKRKDNALTSSHEKQFQPELEKFTRWIAEGKNYSLVRFGDGEMKIINGVKTDLSHKVHGEHKYSPNNAQDERQRALLRSALQHQGDNYHVGIACPCCVGMDNFQALKDQSKQQESHLTWANIFVNSNFATFKKSTTPTIGAREVTLVANQAAKPEGLPFKVKKTFAVGSNAWVRDPDKLLTEISNHLDKGPETDQLFLFCAGVLSNIAIYELTKRYPQNTYLDLGSVYDVELGLGKTRKYLKKGRTLKKTCIWA